MVQTTQAIRTTRRDVEQLSARFNEPEWLLKRRLEAWRLFEEAPMPDPLSEEWKRFPTDRLTLDDLLPFAAGVAAVPEAHEGLAGRLVQRDSTVTHRELDAPIARQGVVLLDLHAAAREHEAIVRDSLGSLVTDAEWKYLSLHGALWSGGCFVYVPAGVEVELPLEYLIEVATPQLALFPHLLIVAEANSKVTVVQEQATTAEELRLNVVAGAVEVIAREGAHVRFVDVQRLGGGAQDFVTMRASLAKDASFQAILLGLGGAITKARLDVLLNKQGARAELLGLFFGDGDQRFYYDTRQDHIAPKTESDLLFKTALDGHAAFVWNGVVDVRKTASQASANQTSRNLLLSDTASASPTPILEINAYDVTKCSHGATVGPVDDEQLFYMQSRGIPADEAEEMLVDGFFTEVIARVPSEPLRERVARVVAEKRGQTRG